LRSGDARRTVLTLLTHNLARGARCFQEAEEAVFEMIGELDTKGLGEIDAEDFVKMLVYQIDELPGEVL